MSAEITSTICKNCGQTLQGTYCHQCGEKVVEPNDFSIKTLLGQFLDGIFNVDSKIFRTFKYLVLKPGQLTSKYVEGIRQPFMKPIQLFLVSNVLFFVLLTQADILRIPSAYYFNDYQPEKLRDAIEKTGQSELEIRQDYDKISADLSKAAVIILVPLLALILLILQVRAKKLFGMHLIFSMHYVSFFFLSFYLAILVHRFGNKPVQIFIILINLIYLILATREFYRNSWLMSILKASLFFVSLIGLTLAYRALVSYISYQLL